MHLLESLASHCLSNARPLHIAPKPGPNPLFFTNHSPSSNYPHFPLTQPRPFSPLQPSLCISLTSTISNSQMTTEITHLSSDLIELILSFLPIPTLVRASTVCKLWCSIISSPVFSTAIAHKHSWFFLYGIHNISSKNNQSFAFDPISNFWLRLPTFSNQGQQQVNTSFIGTSGFFFVTAPKFCYTRILHPLWSATASLNFPRINPLLGVFSDGSDCFKFIVVGGVRFIGNLVDIEDRLPVEIYHPGVDSWELGPPLPADFKSGNSSSSLSSALFGGRFYVFGTYSCFVSSFDLRQRVWSDVQRLGPPGVVFSFLIACRKQLVLAGISHTHLGSSFNLWKVDEKTMEFSEIAIMPQDLLYSLFDSDEDDKFASLKCVGLGDLIFVFNEEYHRIFPACVCEIDCETGKCSWRRVPQLPLPVNKFHKVISFCSSVSLHTILGEREHPGLLQAT